MEGLDTKYSAKPCDSKPQRKIVDGKLDQFFKKLKCAAEVNRPFGLILKENEKMDGSEIFTYTKKTPCWINPILCAQRTTWPS